MIQAGQPERLGAHCVDGGISFALFASQASAVDLCLFDPFGEQTRRLPLPECDQGVWHGFVPGLKPGQAYGFRVHGSYHPDAGLLHNPNKLLLDPYARSLQGEFRWDPAVFGYSMSDHHKPSELDSAPFVPRSVAAEDLPELGSHQSVPWADTVFYEVNLRGYTMAHPALSEDERGRFAGMRNAQVLEYLKSLGITSVELMPVQEFVDEQFLHRRGLRNFWGYNTISFFAPAGRMMGPGGLQDFRDMTRAIHDAGLEVILDVAYNHTGESDLLGPTLAFRGIDNTAYYRTVPGQPGQYINDTGCGNTVNTDHPRVRELILASLRYWVEVMGVDGFRFDLAASLGRRPDGFDTAHPLFAEIDADPVLSRVKRIAEPWDIGPGGYQLGGFPKAWSEWNDQFRDTTRRFWRGDGGLAGELAQRLHGSADRFEHGGRGPRASINLISAHDGFTLMDLVTYEQRHNQANGEDNRDGHAHNFSQNFGLEGPSDNPEIVGLRRRQRLNLLATLLLAQGTPLLLAGDEFGNSQGGNNNAYAQDNETGWLDWSGLEQDPEFTDRVRQLLGLRRQQPLLRQAEYQHDPKHIRWLHPNGRPMTDDDWSGQQALGLLLRDESEGVALLFNPGEHEVTFSLPDAHWCCVFSSAAACDITRGRLKLAALSLAVLTA
ncbi:MAG: glycogen debranching protein GlgX [Xanthomonadales bacterium]|nr:glycogen debranching protein GlgX [Xanthomonadales bacterium]